MKKIIALLLALVMVFALCACGGKTEAPKTEAPKTEEPKTEEPKTEEPKTEEPKTEEPKAEEPKDLTYTGPEMELTVNFNASEEQSPIYLNAFKRVEERTEGKIHFVYYFSGSLLTAGDAMEGLGAGMADFSDVTLNNFKDQFPYTQQVVSYPFLGFTSMAMAADVINDVVHNNDLMLDEFHTVNIHPIIFNAVWGTAIALAEDKAVSTPESVKGLKLVTDDPNLSRFLNEVGATPVAQTPMEFYSSLTNGVADGVVNGLNVINIFGALAPAKHVYMFENSASTNARCICANLDTWNSFDDTLKAIFMEELSGEQYWAESIEYWTVSDQKHLDDAKNWNIPVDYITGEDMQAWVKGLEPYGDETLKTLYDRGYTEVYNVLDIWKGAIANYDGKY